MQIFLMSMTAMITGVIVGSCITYLVIQKSQNQKIAQEYRKKISNLEEMHQQEQEEEKLRSLYHRDFSIHEIASELQRKPGAIRSRLKKLNLL